MKKGIFVLLTVLLTGAVFVSCDLGVTEPEGVTLGVTGNPDEAGLRATRSVSAQEAVEVSDDKDNTLIIDKVEMVFFEINLGVADSEDFEDLEAGPIVMELPLDGSITPIFEAVDITPGQYEELEIEVKIPEGHENQNEFVEQNPDWDVEVSIRVEGTFNDDEFVYTQDFNDDFELEFDPPLEINGGIGLILAIDVGTWFWNEEKTELLDPDSDFDESIVEANIEDSFEAFEDSQEID